jgi:glycosyltransferase involved in cell wall biosynthesis
MNNNGEWTGPDVGFEGAVGCPPVITVAICTRNRARYLQQAVASVLPQITANTEILIVDNGSTDETSQVAAALATANSCITFCSEPMPGIAVARNTALARSKGEYTLFFDDDEIAEPGWLAAYLDFLTRHATARIGCVGGGVVPRFEGAPPAWFDPSQRFDLGDTEFRIRQKSTPWCGNCAYHRSTALAVGGFCAQLRRYEDIEFNARLAREGFEIWWLPGARIQHLIPVDRLTMKKMRELMFSEGRSAALVRLRSLPSNRRRQLYLLARAFASPLHCGLSLLACAVTWPFRNGQIAARAWLRAVRIAGFGWQLLQESRRTLFRR